MLPLLVIHELDSDRLLVLTDPTEKGVVVMHAFGRHCLGFKWAGEVSFLDLAFYRFRIYDRISLRLRM